jgi:hypothetical protein
VAVVSTNSITVPNTNSSAFFRLQK